MQCTLIFSCCGTGRVREEMESRFAVLWLSSCGIEVFLKQVLDMRTLPFGNCSHIAFLVMWLYSVNVFLFFCYSVTIFVLLLVQSSFFFFFVNFVISVIFFSFRLYCSLVTVVTSVILLYVVSCVGVCCCRLATLARMHVYSAHLELRLVAKLPPRRFLCEQWSDPVCGLLFLFRFCCFQLPVSALCILSLSLSLLLLLRQALRWRLVVVLCGAKCASRWLRRCCGATLFWPAWERAISASYWQGMIPLFLFSFYPFSCFFFLLSLYFSLFFFCGVHVRCGGRQRCVRENYAVVLRLPPNAFLPHCVPLFVVAVFTRMWKQRTCSPTPILRIFPASAVFVIFLSSLLLAFSLSS